MSSSDVDKGFVPFSEATRVDKLDSHIYKVDLNSAFSIGAVPNGGYVGSCLIVAGNAHLSSRGQPDLLTAHFEFLAQTTAEPAIIVVEDVKLSRRLSTLHLTLWQGGLLPHAPWITPSVSRRAVLTYATFTNLRALTGITETTGYEITSAAALPGLPDFEMLKTKDADSCWQVSKLPKGSESWRSLRNWQFYLPRAGPSTAGVLDMWIRMASGESIKPGALAYVADSFPYNLHAFLTASPADRAEQTRRDGQRVALWFPTLVMNLNMKMALPDEGVEWLVVRITSKQIKNGMFDLDITIRNVNGELVALSHHVAMIVSIERNTGKSQNSSSNAAL
ncbi:thioesterase family protein [Xylariaceae sp. AK1471]|nr:thioesterase family protein [Xylariaceae sp. AK1471]